MSASRRTLLLLSAAQAASPTGSQWRTSSPAATSWRVTGARPQRNTNPNLPWPAVHAAAMQQRGQEAAARHALDVHMSRHPSLETAQIIQRLPGENPKLVEARERLANSLKEIAMS